jgi:hypothetical protein
MSDVESEEATGASAGVVGLDSWALVLLPEVENFGLCVR